MLVHKEIKKLRINKISETSKNRKKKKNNSSHKQIHKMVKVSKKQYNLRKCKSLS